MATPNGKFLCRNGSPQFHLASSSSSSFASGSLSLRLLLKKESKILGNGDGKKRMVMNSSPAKASSVSESVVISSEPQQNKKSSREGIDVYSVVSDTAREALKIFKTPTVERKIRTLQAELLIERAILDCRFFTFFGVMGSLIGSILCFLEGCFLILESYFQYFHTMWQRLDHGDVMHLVIEAIDMFLVGTAMLNFGMGLYVMFVGTREIKSWLIPGSNHSGLFHQKLLPAFWEMKSVSQAKAQIGHAVVMILQAGVVDKFKNVPLESGLDLACFAGAILVSSAGLFLLSQLRCGRAKLKKKGVDSH